MEKFLTKLKAFNELLLKEGEELNELARQVDLTKHNDIDVALDDLANLYEKIEEIIKIKGTN